jgi:hypothetical protein
MNPEVASASVIHYLAQTKMHPAGSMVEVRSAS